MGLPSINTTIENGSLGAVITTNDAVCGYVLSGINLPDLPLGYPKLITSLDGAENIGITEEYDSANGLKVHQQIESFYKRAGASSPLWILLTPQSMLYEDMVNEAKKLLKAPKVNRIVTLGINRYPDAAYVATKENGLDDDVISGVFALERLREEFAALHRPFRAVIGARELDEDLTVPYNFRTGSNSGVLVYCGNDDGSFDADVAAPLGRRAANAIQRNIGAKADGDIGYLNAYLTNGIAIDDELEGYDETMLGVLHDKGYTFPRVWAEFEGYYFCNDLTATLETDDYSTWANGHVIDKAAVIAYKTFVEHALEENDTDDEGKISPVVIKNYQNEITSQLTLTMVDTGNVTSASCTIDANQAVLSTSELNIGLSVRPKFYNKTINISLGFSA